MEKARITAVSYLNTIPFVWGLRQAQQTEQFQLSLDVPAVCAQKIIDKEVEFGLAPTAILPEIMNHYDILDLGIAAEGEVCSVLLLSKKSIKDIQTIHLDKDSRTSVQLLKVLAGQHWHITPEWIEHATIDGNIGYESALAIGDKAFSAGKTYPYVYDLAEEWKMMTGLPFVFAVWVVRKNVSTELRNLTMEALSHGVELVDQAIKEMGECVPQHVDAYHYLHHCIRFELNHREKEGMEKFQEMIDASFLGEIRADDVEQFKI